MQVLGNIKKVFVGGLMLGSLALTGCLTDDDGEEEPETPSSQDSALVTKSATTLGAQEAVTGSSLDLDEWEVYTMTAAKENSTEIDLIFAYATVGTGSAAIYSPNIAVNGTTGSNGFDFLDGFENPNTTTIKLTSASFANIQNRKQLDSLWSASSAESDGKLEITNNMVFMAESDEDKVVLIQVSNLVTGENGTVSLSAKAKAFD